MPSFASQTELETFAKKFLKSRLAALEKDVKHCLKEPYAPFPAIVWCFSTIDLLGALAAGDATKNANTTQQSGDYMRSFMNYSADAVVLLQRIFRHKLVHLAEPKAVVALGTKKVTWHYDHNDPAKHLLISPIPKPKSRTISTGIALTADHVFHISIMQLVKDVTKSVRQSGGYLARLQKDAALRRCFDDAISQIYAV